MVKCQCIKVNNEQCTRDGSKKSNKNNDFCWQHQKCKNILIGRQSEININRDIISGRELKERLENKSIMYDMLSDHTKDTMLIFGTTPKQAYQMAGFLAGIGFKPIDLRLIPKDWSTNIDKISLSFKKIMDVYWYYIEKLDLFKQINNTEIFNVGLEWSVINQFKPFI